MKDKKLKKEYFVPYLFVDVEGDRSSLKQNRNWVIYTEIYTREEF